MASGDSLGQFFPNGSRPPATNPGIPTTRNDIDYLDYDADTEESNFWRKVLPSNYTGLGITFDIYTIAATALIDDFVAGLSIERGEAGGNDFDVDAFAAEKTVTSTTNGTSGIATKSTISFTNAQIDGLLKNEPYRLKFARKAGAGGDDMLGKLQLMSIYARET